VLERFLTAKDAKDAKTSPSFVWVGVQTGNMGDDPDGSVSDLPPK
jgi:hypothetical protein